MTTKKYATCPLWLSAVAAVQQTKSTTNKVFFGKHDMLQRLQFVDNRNN